MLIIGVERKRKVWIFVKDSLRTFLVVRELPNLLRGR